MPSYSDVDWTDDNAGRINMHGNRDLIQGWLKDQEGFDGFVISDYNGIDHIDPGLGTSPAAFEHRVVTSVNAGVDMFMQPSNFEDFEKALEEAVNTGQVTQARIDDAVSRILTKKFEMGLFEHPYTDRSYIDQVGSAQHRKVARHAVAKSQTLLRNQRGALPLSNRTDLYVAGSNADNIGNQAGGWTLSWQGSSSNQIPGTTILQGIRQASKGAVTFSKDASAPIPKGATGVVVVGETPYAEGFGDVGSAHGQTMQLNANDTAAIDKVCAKAAKCVVVVVSGRPLIIKPAQLRQMDGLVEAWLPGSEGEGVSDPLFGRTPYAGKLPVTWPRRLAQEPINVGDADYNPLYAYGYGLKTR
jgi:beta-glucosidase